MWWVQLSLQEGVGEVSLGGLMTGQSRQSRGCVEQPMSLEQAQTVTTAVPDTGFTTGSFLGAAIRQLTAFWALGET